MLTVWDRHASGVSAPLSRRSFLRVGSLGFGGLSLADVLRRRAAAASPAVAKKSVIMVLLGGGPSHIDMYDLKPAAPAEIRGEFAPIPTNVPGLEISELMPLQARIADKLALVRNLQMVTSSHNYMEITTGYVWGSQIPGGKGPPRPAFGSVVSRLRSRPRVPPFVNLWSGDPATAEDPAYLGPAHRPFIPRDEGLENLARSDKLTLERLADRRQLLSSFDGLRRDADASLAAASLSADSPALDEFRARAFDLITSGRARDAFEIEREPEHVRARYGLTPDLPTYNANYLIWKQFLLARRLVEAGVSVVTLQAFGEWDTHADNFKTLRRLVPVVDRGLSALVADLHERGLADDVAVLVWGEFGRGPRIYSLNGHPPGRDHHGPANFALFAGGGLRMGQVIGATDAHGARPTTEPWSAENVMATLYHVLGIDPAATLPDLRGRPMYLLDDGRPIRELVG